MVGVGGTYTQAHIINNSASSQVHGLSNTQLSITRPDVIMACVSSQTKSKPRLL